MKAKCQPYRNKIDEEIWNSCNLGLAIFAHVCYNIIC